ncbi:MAG TPA: hypothetical protein VNL71_15205, partial [Chloroflexota bacterium]|nr:hypothetical protein [Chloroflexota bacterium]
MNAPKVHQLSNLTVEVAGLRVVAKCARRLTDHIETTALVFNGAPQALAARTGDLHSMDLRQSLAWDIVQAAHLEPDTLPAVEDVLSSLDKMVGPAITMAEAESGQMAAMPSDGGDDGGQGKRKSASTRCLEMCADLELWRTPDGDPYTSFLVDGHRETWPINSTGFRRWLAGEFYRVENQALAGEARSEVLGVLSGRACFELKSEERPAPVRIAHHEGAVYLDLGDKAWRQVRITSEGWTVIAANDSPVHFRRAKGMLALPEPTVGGTLNGLRSVLNVATDEGWILVQAWLVDCLSPGPYPPLVFSGQQGTGKSTAGSLLRYVVDPNKAPLRTAPREERDLAIAAANGHIVAFDNLSTIPDWLSDSLCRLSTGGGLSTRTLYENDEETLFSYKRPCILTSIEDVISRGDLLDRALLVELEPIPEEKRRTEAALWAAMIEVAPSVLGGLLDAVSGALLHLPTTRLARLPRMADFALWVSAAEPTLGWRPGAFMTAYDNNRSQANDQALEAVSILPALRALLDASLDGSWGGGASELLQALTALVDETVRKQTGWPRKPNALAGLLKRIAPNLHTAGVAYWKERGPAKHRVWIHHFALSPTEPEGMGESPHTSHTPHTPSPSPEETDPKDVCDTHVDHRTLSADDRTPIAHFTDTPAREEAGEMCGVCDVCDTEQLPSDRDESAPVAAPANYTYITGKSGLVAAHKDLVQHAVIALDTETTGLDPHTDRIRLVTF